MVAWDGAPRGGQSMGYPTMTRYGWAVAAAMLLSPGGAVHHPVHEVQVVASKFMFEPAAIEVSAGESVRLVLRSKDTVHGFSIPSLKIDVASACGAAVEAIRTEVPTVRSHRLRSPTKAGCLVPSQVS
jgi:heme/copper-type cytochrome/quinol oxidase subunit 2